MQEPIKVDLSDPNNADTQKFLNLIDPLLWNAFITKVKDTANKKSLYELFEELLAGR
jgi:hypothetical protein